MHFGREYGVRNGKESDASAAACSPSLCAPRSALRTPHPNLASPFVNLMHRQSNLINRRMRFQQHRMMEREHLCIGAAGFAQVIGCSKSPRGMNEVQSAKARVE